MEHSDFLFVFPAPYKYSYLVNCVEQTAELINSSVLVRDDLFHYRDYTRAAAAAAKRTTASFIVRI